jgi:hypothetical protein
MRTDAADSAARLPRDFALGRMIFTVLTCIIHKYFFQVQNQVNRKNYLSVRLTRTKYLDVFLFEGPRERDSLINRKGS